MYKNLVCCGRGALSGVEMGILYQRNKSERLVLDFQLSESKLSEVLLLTKSDSLG